MNIKNEVMKRNASIALSSILPRCGKSSYNSNYSINNGIRSLSELFTATVIQYVLLRDNINAEIFMDTALKSGLKADIILVKNKKKYIIEVGGGIHNIFKKIGYNPFVREESIKLLDKLDNENKISKVILAFDTSVSPTEYMKEVAKNIRLHGYNATAINIGFINNMFYSYTCGSTDLVNNNIEFSINSFNKMLKLVRLKPIDEYEFKALVYELYSFANNLDINFQYARFKNSYKRISKLSENSGISSYILHMFFGEVSFKSIAPNSTFKVAAKRSKKDAWRIK